MNKIILRAVLLFLPLSSFMSYADTITNKTVYVASCSACYQMCNTSAPKTTGSISNCQCGGMASLTQAEFSTNLILIGNCGNSTCSLDDLKSTMQNSLAICTYTLTIANQSSLTNQPKNSSLKNK